MAQVKRKGSSGELGEPRKPPISQGKATLNLGGKPAYAVGA
jgi:hypothetical protein